jgi:hypothetical protein
VGEIVLPQLPNVAPVVTRTCKFQKLLGSSDGESCWVVWVDADNSPAVRSTLKLLHGSAMLQESSGM